MSKQITLKDTGRANIITFLIESSKVVWCSLIVWCRKRTTILTLRHFTALRCRPV